MNRASFPKENTRIHKKGHELFVLALSLVWFAGATPDSGFNTHAGTKKEPKPKLLSPDIFGWGRGLPHEGVGPKKFGMSLETSEIKLFWRDIPGFLVVGYPGGARKV